MIVIAITLDMSKEASSILATISCTRILRSMIELKMLKCEPQKKGIGLEVLASAKPKIIWE